MKLKVGSLVTSPEHDEKLGVAIGEVIGLENGVAAIKFTTPASKYLPYGHVITERWPESDWHLLTEVAPR